MSLRQAWFFLTDTETGDGSNYFLIPDDCNCVWVTMIGGGAGGLYANVNSPGVGAAGGASAMPIVRVPVAVKPNGVLTIVVGRGGIGGGNTKYNSTTMTSGGVWGGAPEAENINSSKLSSVITGDILDPGFLCAHENLYVFTSGWSGDSSNAYQVTGPGQGQISGQTASAQFQFTPQFPGTVPLNWVGAACLGEIGVAPFANTTGNGKAGLCVGSGKQVGTGGTWGPSGFGVCGAISSGVFGYGDGGLLGTNGVGGGNIFGSGGDAGNPFTDNGMGGDGQGYGSGGGGGCFNAAGGNGADGFVLLEY